MKIKKRFLLLSLIMVIQTSYAAVSPSGSRYDPRNQLVNYNPLNTTVINSAVGYMTTLVFDEDEKVIEAKTGFPQGWKVDKAENRVYLEVKPVKQTMQKSKKADDESDSGEGEIVSVALDPETDLGRWRTNLFVVTTKRNYSMELNARTFRQPEKIAFVVNYQYPQERRKQQDEIEKKRMAEYQKKQQETDINRSLENAKVPRNWKYYARVAKGSEYIKPDYAYDDGRFTYFGFNPMKKIPSFFVQFGEQETLTNPTVQKRGDFTVVVVPQMSDRFVLRLGNQVIGVENKGFGKVRLPAGDTVSPDVTREVIQ